MDYSDKEKLCTLLDYLIEHNKEHSQEIAEWAEKARALGEDEASERMFGAVKEMDKASEFLSQALERLK